MLGSAIFSATAVYAIWGFAHTSGIVYLFSVVFGAVVRYVAFFCSSSYRQNKFRVGLSMAHMRQPVQILLVAVCILISLIIIVASLTTNMIRQWTTSQCGAGKLGAMERYRNCGWSVDSTPLP